MSIAIPFPPRPAILYPDSDGQPMAENTLQFEYIVTIKGGLDAQFRDDPDVFVAGDLLWYAVEGEPTIRRAPDIFVVFGRPKGYRGSYRQWEEGGISPQVAFEILSPGNRPGKMMVTFEFYERYGVEEYYVFDPDDGLLVGWLRQNGVLEPIAEMNGWVSPLLKVRFELVEGELHLYGPDGRRFLTFVELATERDVEQRQREEAQRQAEQAQQQVEQVQRQADETAQRAERLAAQLRALGIEPAP